MDTTLWISIVVAVAIVLAVGAVVVLVRRRGADRYETYQPGKYNSMDEPYRGPGAQHPQSRPPLGS